MGTVPPWGRVVIAGSAHMQSTPPQLSTLQLAAMDAATAAIQLSGASP